MLLHLVVLLDIGQTVTTLYDKLVRPLVIPAALLTIAYGGFLWMTGNASDDIRRVGKGKAVIVGAIVGALIVWFAPDFATTLNSSLPQ
ncbi:MAG TPA: hypothetical protein VKT82_24390 [Ktedonobacterales bacterium]|nr:hypothetical protein [Ktedonobacterales bacterium]